ncbi:MAG: hypothetical protein M1828_001016 [Chrysothrix sp. TS-e1954]|nr:MAG: hypothetical protein M1828_001016 [Chrysothrix sp. TS-e1954]
MPNTLPNAAPVESGENDMLKPRSYQLEMLDESMKQNIIVAMDTGSGKTHIAIMRIQRELLRCKSDQMAWFLAPRVTLCEQQHGVLMAHLPSYQHRMLTGKDETDLWSDQRLWDASLKDVRVAVSTPQVLLDALTHGYVKMTRLALLIFDEGTGSSWSDILTKLDSICINYDMWDDPYVQFLLDQDDPELDAKIQREVNRKKTYCYRELKAIRNRVQELEMQFGFWSSHWYLKACSDKLRRSCSQTEQILLDEMSVDEKTHLLSILDTIVQGEPHHMTLEAPGSVSSKAERLLRLLADMYTSDFRGLIFVRQRVSVAALTALLKSHPLMQNYGIGSFVGCASLTGRMANVSDLADPKMQDEDLEAFRAGNKNIIVSTNVLEEGIDVPACNVVICYDSPETLISFVQRRGRARQPGSDYLVFYPNGAFDVGKWQQLEHQVTQMYLNQEREIQEQLSLEEMEETSDRHMRITSTEALLTITNAPSHLYHFCATLGGSTAHNQPTFSIEETYGEEKLRKATVTLPMAVDPDLRVACGRQYWRTEKAAKRDAAFEAFVALHKAGLVNDNLMPVHGTIEEEDGIVASKTPSLVSVSRRIDPWIDVARNWKNDARIHALQCTVASANSVDAEMLLLLPSTLTEPSKFRLHWNENECFDATLCMLAPALETTLLDHLRNNTQYLYASTMPGRTSTDSEDFVVLAMPRSGDPPCALHARTISDSYPASPQLGGESHPSTIGLVTDSAQVGAKFIFQKVARGTPSPIGGYNDVRSEGVLKHKQHCLEVARLPKRKDFLHPLVSNRSSNAASSGTLLLPVSRCSVKTMPFMHSRMALFIPSMLHIIEINFVAQHLRQTLLAPLEISSQQLVLTAICASSAREQHNYQRLEFLGDCVLKLSISLQLMALHPLYPESFLSRTKERTVSNQNLTKAALKIGLDRFIVTQVFTGAKWRPQYIEETLQRAEEDPGRRSMSTKMLADVVESLIGAAFLDSFSGLTLPIATAAIEHSRDALTKALSCMQLLITDSSSKWLPISRLHESLLASSLRHEPRIRTEYLAQIESLLGFAFAHKSLLLTALTNPSYILDQTATSYQRLEFLGDAVLDYIVTTYLYAHEPPLNHAQMHTSRTALVNADFLAYLCSGLHTSEEHSTVTRASAGNPRKEPGNAKYSTSTHLTTRPLISYMLHSSASLRSQINHSQSRHSTLRPSISAALDSSLRHPWSLLSQIRYPKVLSDIVEAILGAVYIDSSGDMDACARVLETIGLMGYMRRILSEGVRCVQPKEELGILAGNKSVKYVVSREGEGNEVGRNQDMDPTTEHSDQSVHLEEALADEAQPALIRNRSLLKCSVYLSDPPTPPTSTDLFVTPPISNSTDDQGDLITTAFAGHSRFEIETRAADQAIAILRRQNDEYALSMASGGGSGTTRDQLDQEEQGDVRDEESDSSDGDDDEDAETNEPQDKLDFAL